MTIRIALNPNTNSRAERVLYRMAEMLPGEWDVWMNRVLNFTGAKTGHVNREADCIFYHRKYGLLIVECKSGKISTRYNEERKRVDWFQNDTLMDDAKVPTVQVGTLVSPVHEYLKEMFPENEKGVPYSVRVQWAVCFSDMDTMEGIPGDEIKRKRALLRPDLLNAEHFEKRLIEILEMPENAHSGRSFSNDYLDEESLYKLRSFLDGQGGMPDETEILKGEQEFFEEATETQRMMMDSISRNLRMRIEGVAGSGKSHMVVWEALRLARLNKNVAIVCYNDLLATELKEVVKKVFDADREIVEEEYEYDGGKSYGRIDVLAYFDWCEKYAHAAKIKVKKPAAEKDKQEYYEKVLPKAFVDAQKMLRDKKKTREKFFYDAVIVDEGQDFLSGWVDSFISLLKNSEQGIVRFFYDSAQRLYARDGIYNPQVTAMPVMVLNRGFRCTRKILEWVYKNTNIRITPFKNTKTGSPVKEFYYSDPADQVAMLSTRLDEILEKFKFKPSEILVVSMRSKASSALKNIKDERFVWNANGDKTLVEDKVNIVSAFRIKGLDATAVILVDLEEPSEADRHGDFKRRLLVAATRAKSLLTVFKKK